MTVHDTTDTAKHTKYHLLAWRMRNLRWRKYHMAKAPNYFLVIFQDYIRLHPSEQYLGIQPEVNTYVNIFQRAKF